MTSELKTKVEAAQAEISRLCQEPYYHWTMTIPARETDSDLVISGTIRELVKEVELKDVAYTTGAKETKERALLAIKMAGGMAEQFGNNPLISDTIAHIYVLVEALPVEIK